ncbi:hypothetical protein D3C85_1131080 [compost metagenome]
MPQWPEQLDELAVVRRQLLDVPALAHLQAQGLGGQYVLGGGFEDDGVFLDAEVEQGRVDVGTVAARTGQHHRRNRAETLPLQFFTHLFAFVLGQLREHHQAPGTIPGRHRGAVDPLEGLVETPATGAGQAVVAATTDFLGGQPAFLGQAKNRGADQPLVDADGFEQLNQAAQPDGAAMGFDGIPVQRDDQGTGADRRLLLEAGNQMVQGSQGRHGRSV